LISLLIKGPVFNDSSFVAFQRLFCPVLRYSDYWLIESSACIPKMDAGMPNNFHSAIDNQDSQAIPDSTKLEEVLPTGLSFGRY
jgi:hypothetical protein